MTARESTVPRFPTLDPLMMQAAIQQLQKLISSTRTSKENWKQSCCAGGCSRSKRDTAPPSLRDDNSFLKFLALNALELSLPASDVLLREATPWFQLSGHPDTFCQAGPGRVWKRCSDDTETSVYKALATEPALGVAPHFYKEVTHNGVKYIELQDLLHGFRDPHVMDIKMGSRTFLESEVSNPTTRSDLYQKMVAVDPNGPTEKEHISKAVTKLRYMQFREEQSSSRELGFRVEAMKFRGSPPVTDLKRVKHRSEVLETLSLFVGERRDVLDRLVSRLEDIRSKLEASQYLRQHEVIGSSILVVYDDCRVGAWLIDFAKTKPLPDGVSLDHRSPWVPGNHEEGFLVGLDNLIQVFKSVQVPNENNTVKTTGKRGLTLKS